MKPGDKIYCIRDLTYLWQWDSKSLLETLAGHPTKCFYHSNTSTLCNRKGKEYIIDEIAESIYVRTENNSTPYGIYGLNETTFNIHFVTGKEYRKLKLKKLNENWK